MKSVHQQPFFVALFIGLLAISFLLGTTITFHEASAAATATKTATAIRVATTPSPTQEPVTYPASANMTGILILGVLLVTIIVFGLVWGRRFSRK